MSMTLCFGPHDVIFTRTHTQTQERKLMYQLDFSLIYKNQKVEEYEKKVRNVKNRT